MEIQAKIKKESIESVHDLKGTINDSILFGCGARSVVFLGFSGRQEGEEQVYSGVLRFRPVEDAEEPEGGWETGAEALRDHVLASDTDSVDEDNDMDATNAALDLAEEHDLDISNIEGTGKNGRVVKQDVQDEINEEESRYF